MSSEPVLHVSQLSAGYHGGTVIHDLSFQVEAGKIHAIVGHNGAGKTTLMNTIAGLVPASRGRIYLEGADITKMATNRRARSGIGCVSQGRRVFASVSVKEHLTIAFRGRRTTGAAWTPQRAFEAFPQLADRGGNRGAQLSGGEQQMLAISRALMTQPRLLLLDEPTEGLAPAIVDQIRDTIVALAADGMAIVLAAPQPEMPVAIADHISVLTSGRLTTELSGDAARDDNSPLLSELGLSAVNPTIEAVAAPSRLA